MEEKNTEAHESASEHKDSTGKASKRWVIWALVALVVLLLSAAGYLGWLLQQSKDDEAQLKKDKQSLQEKVDALEAEAQDNIEAADTKTDVCSDTPTTAMKDNIKAALDSKNTAAFATYFSDPVTFVIAATEKGGSESAAQAASDMDYANTATGPWDFSLPAATIAHYDAGFYTSYFDANTYVGRAASGQVAAFDFDCDGKIKQAFLAINEDIL